MSLIVRSKVKSAVKGMRFAGDFYDALDKKVDEVIKSGKLESGFDEDARIASSEAVAAGISVSRFILSG